MPKSVLSDVQQFSFRNVDFDAYVVEWGDFRRPRLAFHEYLKRDGSEAEYMGRAPHETRLTLVYVGPQWRKQLAELQQVIDEYPIGPLIHAFYGRMQMACTGVENTRVSIEDGLDTVTVPISFRESNLDKQLLRDQVQQGPSFRQTQTSSYSATLTTASSTYTTAAASIAAFTGAAATYAAAAVATTMSTGSADPTLPTQLALVAAYAQTARDAVRADPQASSDAATYSVISYIELILDSCNQLDDSLKYVKPTLAAWTVPAQTTLLAIAQAFYGRDAAARLSEIQANNVGKMLNPAAIAAGTTLMLAPPTVKAF